MDKKSLFSKLICILVVFWGVPACTLPVFGGFGAKSQTREEFARHVEEIFRLQNQMTSLSVMLLDSGDVPNADDLRQAERHMQHVCADLNEYVSRDMDGLSSSMLLLRRVERSAIACEQAALVLKPLLGL